MGSTFQTGDRSGHRSCGVAACLRKAGPGAAALWLATEALEGTLDTLKREFSALRLILQSTNLGTDAVCDIFLSNTAALAM
jgi:hypothetical protein